MLTLSALEVRDGRHWRWLLSDSAGNPLADHEVAVNPQALEFEGFVDLCRFLRRHADPDRRQASEAELVARVGRWIGVDLLGRVGEALLQHAPVTVEVMIPMDARWLMFRPWEIAEIAGRKLAGAGVSFVFVLAGQQQRDKDPIRSRLRILAVFSLPSEQSVLALRQERYALQRLVRDLAGRDARAIDLHVLQYGVTRKRFEHAAEDGEGWDILHMSGHGLADGLVLEHPDGSSDLVRTSDLIELLRPLRGRTKLAVLSSCQSGAARTAETLRWLRLDQPSHELEATAETDGGEEGEDGVPALGCAVMEKLDCAVLAMRFPVADRFAIRFAGKLYQLLLDRGQSLDEAVRNALLPAVAPEGAVEMPAISIGTPALFGQRALDLALRPPAGQVAGIPAGGARMAGFPEEPTRFVGRAGLMATATATLASESGSSGVIFNGMAGAGKTACALELSYRHENGFAGHAFWRAPQTSEEALGALPQFAQRMETLLGPQLRGGFEMIHAVSSDAELDRFLPQLTQLLETTGLLIVLDNLETLLTEGGEWRDPRWGRVIDAMCDHRGLSRVVMTSRIVPNGLRQGVKTLPVGALSLAEAALLARELPHLGVMMTPSQVDGQLADVAARRALVRRALAVVQGHPKLLELADAAAADVEQLASRVAAAERHAAECGAPLEAFFLEGESEFAPQRFIEAMASWTRNAMSALDDGALLLLQYLGFLEEGDRVDVVIEDTWGPLWTRLGRDGEAPQLSPALDTLVAAALVDVAQIGTVTFAGTDESQPAFGYGVHPGVAESVRANAPPELRTVVDGNASDYWRDMVRRAVDGEEHLAAGGVVLQAALAALPYLLRLERWDAAAEMLDRALRRTTSPSLRLRLLPYLRQLDEVMDDPRVQGMLGHAVSEIDPVEGERCLRQSLERSWAADDLTTIRAAYFSLTNLMLSRGAFRDALALCDERAERLPTDDGSWDRFADDVQRLQIESMLEPPEKLLPEVKRLTAHLDRLTESSDAANRRGRWALRETLYDTGHTIAMALERLRDALDFNQQLVVSMRGRGASADDLALVEFNDVGPLVTLGHLADGARVLDSCQAVFEAFDHTEGLSLVYGSRANIERVRGHVAAAVELNRVSLRLAYVKADPYQLQTNHHNVSLALYEQGSDPDAALVHALAAVLLCHWCQMGHEREVSMRLLTQIFGTAKGPLRAPGSVDELANRLDGQPGVSFGALANTLVPLREQRDGTLAEVLDDSRALAESHAERLFAAWRPAIPVAVLERELDKAAESEDWTMLVALFRRVLAGDRGGHLLRGLDGIDSTIARELLSQLDGASGVDDDTR